ncbi:MAG TPA: Uma2 family endonuclease [Chroococcales cyanobacterium]
MVQFDPLLRLPTSEELPDSDDTPVDNEIQNLIPNLLLTVLSLVWRERQDWFLGVDMGIYYLYEQVRQPALVPDGFLSLGVERYKGERGRLSYVLWEENNISPIWALEIVSQTPGGEYHDKILKDAQLGVLYYTIYNPDYWRRDKHEPFEVYRLVQGEYIRQSREPFWMPEVGLGIGRGIGTHERWTREWLYWYDQQGNRLSIPEEIIEQERRRAEQAELQLNQERQQAQQKQRDAIAQLFSLGLSVEQIAGALSLSVQDVKQVIED